MPVGLIERVKQQFASKKTEPAPARQAQKKSEVLGSMSFDQAQAFLTPNGPLDRSRRPPASSYQTLPLKKPASMYASPLAPKPQGPVSDYVTTHDVRQPSSMYASPLAKKEAPSAKDDKSMEAASASSQAVERAHPALGGDALAALRKGAEHEGADRDRDPLSDEEQQLRGWALLPMQSYEKMNDARGDSHKDGFSTVYHYDDEADRDAHAGGFAQTTSRKDHIVELKNGRFVFAKSGAELDSRDLSIPGFTVGQVVRDKKAEIQRSLDDDEMRALMPDVEAKGGRYIFVMDAHGAIYAGENLHKVQHHSSFMGGGAVAAAGELQVSGGKLTLVSNMSGHYRPGPGYLWQALVQMQSQGVDLAGVTAEILGVGPMKADEFLRVLDPVANPELMQAPKAIELLRKHVQSKRTDDVTGANGKTETTYV